MRQTVKPIAGLSSMTALQVMIDARAKIVKPEYWGKGRYHNEGRYCMDGAMLYCEFPCSAYSEARHALCETLGQDVVDFNDAPERTHAEVLAAFDKAIVAERAKVQS